MFLCASVNTVVESSNALKQEKEKLFSNKMTIFYPPCYMQNYLYWNSTDGAAIYNLQSHRIQGSVDVDN